ncbi:amino acid adenylation domain-containing protein [Pseudomonas graminis]|uniref:amino acid adenylation domain-containing protein n=1 Tax=Pseudomonas graminis TaxID=158627 RepID=UPI00234A09A5|nr:amino acid adenylation domain-containing protein [Pseudomonas graminis]MDC6379896.1 amino acid adenylation domain-containing protein [Pseudomonas graminis]
MNLTHKATATATQRRLVFNQVLAPTDCSYNISLVVEIQGPLCLPSLSLALTRVILRHEVLRQYFTLDDQGICAWTTANSPSVLQIISLEYAASDDRLSLLLDQIAEGARLPFDLSTPPLLRTKLIKFNENSHFLVLEIHHSIFDGRSGDIFISELSVIYEGLINGVEAELSEVASYSDYAKQVEEEEGQQHYKAQLGYWKTQLSDLSYVRGDIYSSEASSVKKAGKTSLYSVPALLATKIQAYALAEKTTPYLLLHSVFVTLLYKYFGVTDLCISTPVSTRSTEESETTIGPFINTIVLRSNIVGQQTFESLMESNQIMMMDAYSNSDVPFDHVVREVAAVTNLDSSKINQFVVVAQPEPEPFDRAGLKFKPWYYPRENSIAALSLSYFFSSSGIRVWIGNNETLFAAEEVDGIYEDLLALIRQVIDTKTIFISNLMLASASKCEIDQDHNLHTSSLPALSVDGLFLQKAVHSPDDIAIYTAEESLTFSEVVVKMKHCSHALVSYGVRHGDVVALLLESGPSVHIVELAIMHIGAAFLPLDARYPSARILDILDDATPRLIISGSSNTKITGDWKSREIDLSALWQDHHQPQVLNLGTSRSLNDAAYYIYTSGSTGRPKGVVVSHKHALAFADSLCRSFSIADWRYQKVSSLASNAFDASLRQLLFMCFGATIYVIPEQARINFELLYVWLKTYKPTVVNFTPSLFSGFLKFLEISDNQIEFPEVVILGGEVIKPSVLEFCLKDRKSSYYNVYGPTECTIHCTDYLIQDDGERYTIGTPLPNTSIYILDEDMNNVPSGVVGEIFIGGESVSYGYINNTYLTAKNFVPNPFSSRPGDRLYKSGDLGRRLSNQNIEFIGRIDSQIKIRGHRVELSDIEAQLQRMSSVDDSVVLLEKYQEDLVLVACIVLKSDAVESSESVRAWVSDRLPDYMLPRFYRFYHAFPLTKNNKVDRNVLSCQFQDLPQQNLDLEKVPTADTSIDAIREIWASMLGRTDINLDSDFFALGGHSLLAVRVISIMQKNFNVKIPLSVLFEYPTILGVSAFLDRNKAEPIAAFSHMIAAGESPPTSYAQEGIWILEKMTKGPAPYNIPMLFTMDGSLDVPLLECVLQQLIDRHEAFRTGIEILDDSLIQKVVTNVNFNLPILNISTLCPEDQQAESVKIVDDMAEQRLDLSCPPLLNILLIILNNNKHLLLVVFHHSIFDAWSGDVFIRELLELYSSRISGREPKLPELTNSYTSFARRERDLHDHSDFIDLYWKDLLPGDESPLPLPFIEKSGKQTGPAGRLDISLSSETFSKLILLGLEFNISHFMLMYAIFLLTIHKITGADDICVGTPVANRHGADYENVVGAFVNLIILRNVIAPTQSIADFLGTVRRRTLQAYDHQDYPFSKLVRSKKLRRQGGATPLINTVFGYQQEPSKSLELEALNATVKLVPSHTARFELTMNLYGSAGLQGYIEYRKDLLSPAFVDLLASTFINIAENMSEIKNKDMSIRSCLGDY